MDSLKKGVYGNSHPRRHKGKTMMVKEGAGPSQDMYGGGRKGAKQ